VALPAKCSLKIVESMFGAPVLSLIEWRSDSAAPRNAPVLPFTRVDSLEMIVLRRL
jgi:hypothetical protein